MATPYENTVTLMVTHNILKSFESNGFINPYASSISQALEHDIGYDVKFPFQKGLALQFKRPILQRGTPGFIFNINQQQVVTLTNRLPNSSFFVFAAFKNDSDMSGKLGHIFDYVYFVKPQALKNIKFVRVLPRNIITVNGQSIPYYQWNDLLTSIKLCELGIKTFVKGKITAEAKMFNKENHELKEFWEQMKFIVGHIDAKAVSDSMLLALAMEYISKYPYREEKSTDDNIKLLVREIHHLIRFKNCRMVSNSLRGNDSKIFWMHKDIEHASK